MKLWYFLEKWMNLDINNLLSEIKHIQKDKYVILPFIYGI